MIIRSFSILLLLFSSQLKANPISKSEVPFGLTEVDCLALNMYHEARSEESVYDIAAVGYVTLQRVQSDHWPNTVCKAVYEQRLSNKSKKYIPMYSWTKDNISDIPLNFKAYNKCLIIARKVLSKKIRDYTKKATHYHNNLVNPYWAKSLIKTAILGNHIFYR